MPLERDINIAINGPFWVEVANPEHPFTAMLISRSNGTCLIPGKPPPVIGGGLDFAEGASKFNWGLELYNGDASKQFKMGESPSFGTLSSARGLAKLAVAMADRGQARCRG